MKSSTSRIGMSGTLGVYDGSEDREWKIEDGRMEIVSEIDGG